MDLVLHHFQTWLMLKTLRTMVVLRVVVVVVVVQQHPKELVRREQVLQVHPCFFYEENQPWTL